jgi:peptidoglycan/LPS O-acetylase OafA/YrhL
VKSALPWLGTLLGGALLLTPTYGIGVVIAPLTLIGSWTALFPLARASPAVRVGAAFNLFIVVAALSLLTAIWGSSWPALFAIAWLLVVVIVLLAYATLSRSRQGRPGDRASAV